MDKEFYKHVGSIVDENILKSKSNNTEDMSGCSRCTECINQFRCIDYSPNKNPRVCTAYRKPEHKTYYNVHIEGSYSFNMKVEANSIEEAIADAKERMDDPYTLYEVFDSFTLDGEYHNTDIQVIDREDYIEEYPQPTNLFDTRVRPTKWRRVKNNDC